jgi:acetoin utilization protein AcuB
MSSPVATIAAGESAERAWHEMQRANTHHLVVLDGREIAGVISSHDLADEERRVGTVGERMTTRIVTAEPGTTVRDAANLLRGHIIGCLPIVEGDKLVGIVTLSDLLELLGRGALRPSPRAERKTLPRRGPTHHHEPDRR